MCFTNDGKLLAKYRKRKRPIIVWKIADINKNSGFAETFYQGHDRVRWEQGAVVHPMSLGENVPRMKCYRDGHQCRQGLYFYVDKERAKRSGASCLIKASVNPKDVIGVGPRGIMLLPTVLCAKAAKVLQAPYEIDVRIKWLKLKLGDAQFEQRKFLIAIAQRKEIALEREEAIEQMKQEFARLTAKK